MPTCINLRDLWRGVMIQALCVGFLLGGWQLLRPLPENQPVPLVLRPAPDVAPEAPTEPEKPVFSPFTSFPIKQSSSPMPKGRYRVSLKDANGVRYRLSIFARQEKEERCVALGGGGWGEGGRRFSGAYQVAVQRRGDTDHTIEGLALFGGENEPRSDGKFLPGETMIYVVPGQSSPLPDVLVVCQYAGSNNVVVRLFSIDKGMLVPIVMQSFDGRSVIDCRMSRGYEMERQGKTYLTWYYDISDERGAYQHQRWLFQPENRAFKLIKQSNEFPN